MKLAVLLRGRVNLTSTFWPVVGADFRSCCIPLLKLAQPRQGANGAKFCTLPDRSHLLFLAGDHLRLQVLRDGEVQELSYEVRSHKLLVPTLHGVDGCTPTYFTIAGLIFVPLSIPFLEHAYGGARPGAACTTRYSLTPSPALTATATLTVPVIVNSAPLCMRSLLRAHLRAAQHGGPGTEACGDCAMPLDSWRRGPSDAEPWSGYLCGLCGNTLINAFCRRLCCRHNVCNRYIGARCTQGATGGGWRPSRFSRSSLSTASLTTNRCLLWWSSHLPMNPTQNLTHASAAAALSC